MMKILYITAFKPSKVSAGENFSRQLIEDIACENQVDLIFFRYSSDGDFIRNSENIKIVRQFKNSNLIKLLNCLMFPFFFPLFTVRFNISRLLYIRKLIANNRYDTIIFDFSQTFLYAIFIKHKHIILNCHDVIAQRYSRIYRGVFKPFVLFSESKILKKSNAVIFCHSHKDKRLILDLYGIRANVTSLYFDKTVKDTYPEFCSDYFVFFANWSRPDNSYGLKWFLKEVYSRLSNDINVKIIGSGLPAALLDEIKGYQAIEYLGFLENPYQIISNARALISPLFTGAGIKVKVMESLACGTPVIGTGISFEGVPEIFGDYLLNAENQGDFVTKINEFRVHITDKMKLKTIFLNYNLINSLKEEILKD
jgi:glycosyltransferase involved in cell wall biosynthesis